MIYSSCLPKKKDFLFSEKYLNIYLFPGNHLVFLLNIRQMIDQ